MSTEFVLIPKEEYQRLKDHPAASNKEKKSPELPVKRLVVAGKKSPTWSKTFHKMDVLLIVSSIQ